MHGRLLLFLKNAIGMLEETPGRMRYTSDISTHKNIILVFCESKSEKYVPIKLVTCFKIYLKEFSVTSLLINT